MLRLLIIFTAITALLAALIASGRAPDRADLTFADIQPAFTLDPQRMSYEQDFRLAYALYEGLVRWDNDTFEVLPAAAESWTISPDLRTYTFTIRPDAKWSNGAPVTAHDFVYAWTRACLPDTAANYTQLLFFIDGAQDLFEWRTNQLETYANLPTSQRTPQAAEEADAALDAFAATYLGARALSENILEVRLKRPTPFILDLLCFATYMPVYPPAIEAFTTLDPTTARRRQRPGWTKPGYHIANGPYALTGWRFKRDMRLQANPHYAGPANPRSKTITIRTIENPATAALAFETGAIDWLTDVNVNYLPDLVQEELEGKRNDVRWFPNFGTYFWSFNCTPKLADGRDNPLYDPRVRRALAMAVDKKALVERVRRVGEPVANTLIPFASLAPFDEFGKINGLPYNPKAARELLAQAGWQDRDSDGVVENLEGKPFPVIELLCTTGSYHHTLAQAMQAMWEHDLAIQSAIFMKETKTYRADIESQDYMMARGGWFGDYGDPSTFLALHRTGDGNNDRGYSDPVFDDLYDRALAEPDPVARMQLFHQAERYTMEESLPILPIFTYVQFYLADPRLEGLSTHPRKQQYLFELFIDRERTQ